MEKENCLWHPMEKGIMINVFNYDRDLSDYYSVL